MTPKPSIVGNQLLGAPLARRTLLTLFTAASMTGLYGLYHALVTPHVSPGKAAGADPSSSLPIPPPPPENLRMAEQYLPSQPWAAEAKYQFRTSEAFVYANEWEPVENNQAVRFRPFAMIFLSPSRKADEPPVTIVGEWAYLRFEKKFDVNEPEPGRVIYAALQGKVRVSGPDNLVIDGRNFIFSESSKKLWSDEKVTFQYAQHRGQGFGLEAFLIADETATQNDSIAVTGVQSIRLRKNVAMELSFPQGSDRNKRPGVLAAEARAGGAKKKADEPVEISVRSTGSFEFDVEANVGTFSDIVRVYRPTGLDAKGKPVYDSLHCEQLTLSFEPKADAAPFLKAGLAADGTAPGEAVASVEGAAPADEVKGVPEAPADNPPVHRRLKDGQREGNFRNLDTRLEFRRARARGKPGKPVVLISESNNLTAYLSDLIYDVQARVVSLTSPENVRVLQGTSELRSPGVTLAHDERGRVTTIRCQGPGWLNYRDPETNALQLAAQWQHQLRKYPDAESGLDVLELEQQAQVRQPGQKTGLAADFIKLWMDPQDLRTARAGEPRDRRADSVRLQKLIALRDVALVSPEMHGKTNRLEVVFEAPATELPPPPETSSLRSPPSEGGAVARSGSRRRIREEADSESDHPDHALRKASGRAGSTPSVKNAAEERLAAESEKDAGDPKKTDKNSLALRAGDGPIEVYSDLIRVRAVQGKTQRESRMEEVWTEGNVEVTQEHGDDEEPLVVTGDKLHLENRSETDQVLHVSGAPAHIYDRGMHIEGKNVHLDRVENHAWVDGAGLLQLPVKSGLNGETLESQQLLDVWWKEKMTFDGEFARFFGDVRTVLNDSKMQCEDMEVKMTSRISFTGRERDRDVKVEKVDCRDGVRFDSKEYIAGATPEARKTLSEVRHGHVARFTLDQITGNTQAHGPGHIEFWRRSNGQRQGLGGGLVPGGAAAKATRPASGEKAERATGAKTPKAGESSAKTGDKKGDGKDKDAKDPHWEYTRVEFAGNSDGNIQQRFTKFEERVHVVYGPVDQPPSTIDPDKLPAEGGWMVCDSLRLQQVADEVVGAARAAAKPGDAKTGASKPGDAKPAETKPGDARGTPKPQGHVELLAQGNVDLYGRTFNAKADRVTYDESKGLYTIRSLGTNNATIYRQKEIGGEYDYVTAQEMRFYPASNDVQFIKTRIASGSQ